MKVCVAWASALFLLTTSVVGAAEPSNEALFAQGAAALDSGDYGRAIAVYETLADRGFTHPDVSYNRGLSYAARIRAKQGKPGDYGRAAAGFEETLLFYPGDQEAAQALELVRAEVARRGSRTSEWEMELRPSLDRIIVGLAPENAWAVGALLFALVLTVGLVMRQTKAGATHMAGTIATPIGLTGLLLFALLAGRARHVRMNLRPAVVVATEARMLTREGTALLQEEPIPEAARIEVVERNGLLAKVRYGQREAWTHASSLRELSQPD